MRKFIIAGCVFIFSCSDGPTSGRNLSEIGFYSSPAAVITELSGGPVDCREYFMLGHAYKKEKKYKESIFHFANSCFKGERDPKLRLFPQPVYFYVKGMHFKSDYYDDSVYELAHLFTLYNEHAYVIKFTDLISRRQKVLFRDAMLLKARSQSALKRYDDARATLTGLLGEYSDPDSQSIINLRLGSLMEKKTDHAGAMGHFFKVLAIHSKGWQSVSAAKRTLKILERNPRKLTVAETLLLGRSLYHAGKFREALPLLSSLLKNKPEGADAARSLVRALARVNETREAESVIRQFSSDGNRNPELVNAYADELWSMNKKTAALPLYQELMKGGVEPQARHAHRRLARYMEERKNAGYEGLLTGYADKYSDDYSGQFLWLLARNLIRSHDTDRAVRLLERSLAKYPSGSDSDNCRFWLRKVYAERGNTAAANKMAAELAVKNPDSAYTWLLIKQLSERRPLPDLERAYHAALKEGKSESAQLYHMLLFMKERSLRKRTARLSDIDSPDIGRFRDLERAIVKMKVSSNSGIYGSIEKYFIVGYMPGITRELKIIPKSKEGDRDKHIALAHFSRKYRFAFLSVYSFLELLKQWSLKENIALMPEESLQILFPKPFESCITQHAREYAIGKNMLYSLIKAESLFKHDAVSSARAMGLMQLMPPTARGIARSLKLKQYNLFDPCTSILFGAKYVSGLVKEFRGNFQYAVAAYNAGSGNVDKWKSRLNTADMDFFTEFTPFIETRYYILRTDKFLTQYGLIYSD